MTNTAATFTLTVTPGPQLTWTALVLRSIPAGVDGPFSEPKTFFHYGELLAWVAETFKMRPAGEMSYCANGFWTGALEAIEGEPEPERQICVVCETTVKERGSFGDIGLQTPEGWIHSFCENRRAEDVRTAEERIAAGLSEPTATHARVYGPVYADAYRDGFARLPDGVTILGQECRAVVAHWSALDALNVHEGIMGRRLSSGRRATRSRRRRSSARSSRTSPPSAASYA